MSDLISRQDAIDALSHGKEILCRVLDDMDVIGIEREKYSWGLGLVESNINDIEELPTADRPQGEVDSVKLYEQAISDLENNKITLGEYEARIEPLKHLYYDRPHGEWVSNHDGSWNCSECGLRVLIYAKGNFCPNCGARMKGADDEN